MGEKLNVDSVSDWFILYSKGVGSHPNSDPHGWRIDLSGDDEIDYVQRSYGGAFRNQIKDGNSRIEIDLGITASADAVWKATQGGAPAITAMLRIGTDLTNANNRLWCKTNRLVIAPGRFTLVVPVARDKWSNVDGQTPSSSAWGTMLNSGQYFGLTFGGTFFGHGVSMDNGSSSITCARVEAF